MSLFKLWGGSEPDPRIDQNRKPQVQRPCPCGCDNRGRTKPLVGYLSGSRNGLGITIEAPDEATYQRMLAVFGGKE